MAKPAATLRNATRAGALRIGTSGWHYTSWRGPFYPPKLRTADFLAFYQTRFSSAEINNSFYRLPSEEAVAAWRESTPDDFLFPWKASRFITHMKKLKGVEESIDLVFGRMAGLGQKSGPVLFQLPPMLRGDRERLGAFLSILPKSHRYTIEFRHPSWYEPPILDLLREHDASLCLSDHADAPAPWEVTASFVYIRGHGSDGRYAGNYSDETLDAWARHIAKWRRQGRDVYCYFDNDIKSAAPTDAERLTQRTRGKRG